MPDIPSRSLLFARHGQSLALLVVLAGLILVFGFFGTHFLSAATFHQIANQVPALTVLAVGMTFVVLTGAIDLSVGSVMAFSGAILGLAMTGAQIPLPFALPIAMIAGAACGLANGWISVRFALPSFIVTLGMMQIARGLAYLATGSQTVHLGQGAALLGVTLPVIGISLPALLAVVLVIAGQILLDRTVFGRHLLAIGANEEAAVHSGIRTRPLRVLVFVFAGALAGLAASFNSARLGAVDPNAGLGIELSAIAAVVVGGTRLTGGRGSVTGSFLGVLIIATLDAGLANLGVSEPVKFLVTGLVIVLAVVGDAWRSGKGHRKG